ncbi:MAG: hypothetical protein ACKER6_00630 [Candidatus Hodgkinia cicadicola]
MAPSSLDKSPTFDGAMNGLLRPAIGLVCIVVGVFVCANSMWSSLKRLWRPTFGRSADAASFARKMAAAHAAIGYLKSEVLADAAVSRELDRLMRHNGSVEPEEARAVINVKTQMMGAKTDAGGAIGKIEHAYVNANDEVRSFS